MPVAAGQLEAVQALAARGMDLMGSFGCAVLAAAVQAGAAPLVRWLLGEGRCDVAAALEQVSAADLSEACNVSAQLFRQCGA